MAIRTQQLAAAAASMSLAAAGCATSRTDATLTERQARAVMVSVRDVAGGSWTSIRVPAGQPAGAMGASSDDACWRATNELAHRTAIWSTAPVDVTAAFANADGREQALLKVEIASDPHHDAAGLQVALRRQATACPTVTSTPSAVVYAAKLRACVRDRGITMVQTWTADDGRSGTTRYAYLFRGHVLAAITLTEPGVHASCRVSDFDAITATVIRRLDAAG